MKAEDQRFMAQALRAGRRNMGNTGDNPSVGCVIVKNGVVLGVGTTAPGGRPHAEPEALKMAGDAARGATAYVTLEPCSHVGRTPACADTLIRAGIARAVISTEDPDPRVSGGGIAKLKAAGIETHLGLMGEEARHDLAGFFSRIIKARPHVTLKLALSADGMMAARPGERTRITGHEAKQFTYQLRAKSDAIMVGIGTVLADDPMLDCALPGLEARSPIRVIADARTALPLTSRLLATAHKIPVWLLTLGGSMPDEPHVSALRIKPNREGRLDMADALARLAKRGINRLMSEGGARLAESLLKAKLVDELIILQSPHELGSGGLKPEIDFSGFRKNHEEMLGLDRMTVYEAQS